MSNARTIRLSPSTGFFSRLMATVDRALMARARAAVRRGDLPYVGL